MANFGDELKRIRKEQNLTQKDVAERMGISRQAYSQFEQAADMPKGNSVDRLADALNVAPASLYTKTERSPVGGVDRSGKIDKISLQMAVETPFWMAVWAAEPTRPIDVSMTYEDLKIICDLIDKKRKEIMSRNTFINCRKNWASSCI